MHAKWIGNPKLVWSSPLLNCFALDDSEIEENIAKLRDSANLLGASLLARRNAQAPWG